MENTNLTRQHTGISTKDKVFRYYGWDAMEALYNEPCAVTTYNGETFEGKFQWDMEGLDARTIDLVLEDGRVMHFRYINIKSMRFGR
ncbi:MAG: hypothetical protein LUD47_07830 [Clostridia bacterium]|nr:hypothetical protein [Clostridia bacterium]